MSQRAGKWRRGLARVGLWRIALTAVLALAAVVLARHGTTLPVVKDVENAAYDIRAVLAAPGVAQDPRIVLVTYTDDTLERTGKRSPLDRALLAKALANLDAMGPRAIGIDILIDQPQAEDAELTAAMRALKTPTFLAFARTATNEDSVLPWQEAFQRRFQAGLAPGPVRPASIRLDIDPDGVLRSWPIRHAGDPPLLVDRIAPAGLERGYDRSIDFRLPASADRPVFASLPIDLFESALAAPMLRDTIAGRVVLIGGDIKDLDRFDTPARRLGDDQVGRQITGLNGHAALIAQSLDGRFPPAPSSALLWAAALVVVLAAAATGLRDFPAWALTLLIVGELVVIALLPVLLAMWVVDTRPLPQFGWLVGWALAFIAAASLARSIGSDQRRFAQSTLGRYLPRDVAAAILKDPDQLTLTGERRHIYCLFSDLEGFTKLTHAVTPEQIATLLNRYLDQLSAVVLAHGGTIDKFVGDAVIAFWGAPLARPDDADRALAAVKAMVAQGEAFRREAPAGTPPIGRTRVGLHYGEAIVGNFGGEGRIQYTALGDAMNTASRMEGANKKLETAALVSAEAAAGMTSPALRAMGRITVRGRATPITVFEPAANDAADNDNALVDLIARFDAGHLDAADEIASRGAGDSAVANLAQRLKACGPGGSYAVD